MIERADIEAKAKEIEAALAETKEAAKNTAVLAAVAVVAVVAVAFLMGRRRGANTGKAVVEVYRVR
ncbi:MAG TPA: hypothetical protein VIY70_10700 [Acidimicrobiia bacterium]